ncbi:MAG: hypothetical protein KC517_02695 [Bacteroidetes bacterium]|jgi:[ribosomal protein S5]-alanine N-acetyltransferase|nr:hypothetical protein [Bacteroidota bacterium]
MKIQLRPLTVGDTSDLATHANNVKIAQNLTNQFPHPYSLENANQFISMMMDKTPPNVLAIEVDGALAGAIGIHPQEDIWCADSFDYKTNALKKCTTQWP